jgi:hypothetical protein
MAPTFSYTLNSSVYNPPSSFNNPISGSKPTKSGNWFYYLIKNSGSSSETLSNITLDSGYTWYMCLIANGGSGGSQNTTVTPKIAGGGGGNGQVVTIKLDSISSVVLNPISSSGSSPPVLTTFTTDKSFTTTNGTKVNPVGTVKSFGTYSLYPGLPGSSSNGNGGNGGSATSSSSAALDPGCIGSAGGGAGIPSSAQKGTAYNAYSDKFVVTDTNPQQLGTIMEIPFSDGTTNSLFAGGDGGQFIVSTGKYNSANSGNISQVMFYCVANS